MRLIERRRRAARMLLAPMVLVLLLVAGWPLLRTVWMSCATIPRAGDAPDIGVVASVGDVCAGWANYLVVLTDPNWWLALRNTLVFTAGSVVMETVFGIAIALALASAMPGRPLLRAAVLVPWAIPTTVSAQMWSWMLHDVFGVINRWLVAGGLLDDGIAWTAQPGLVMLTLIAVDVWKTTPFVALLVLAGLQSVPTDCYEAARIDGVSPWRVFRKVTLPLIAPAVAVAVIFRTLDALRSFDLMYVMTGQNVQTMTLSLYVRQWLVDFQQTGVGSASATLTFFLIALTALAMIRIGRVELVDRGIR